MGINQGLAQPHREHSRSTYGSATAAASIAPPALHMAMSILYGPAALLAARALQHCACSRLYWLQVWQPGQALTAGMPRHWGYAIYAGGHGRP